MSDFAVPDFSHALASALDGGHGSPHASPEHGGGEHGHHHEHSLLEHLMHATTTTSTALELPELHEVVTAPTIRGGARQLSAHVAEELEGIDKMRLGARVDKVNLGDVSGPLSMFLGAKQMFGKHSSVTDRIAGAAETVEGTTHTLSLVAKILGSTELGGAAAATAPIGAVAGAGATGYQMAKAGSEALKRLGWLGKQNAEYGNPHENRDASDLAADAGRWVRRKLGGGTVGKIAGGATTILASGVTGAGAAVTGVVDTIGSAGKSLGSASADAFSTVTGVGLEELGPDPRLLHLDGATGR